MFLLTEGANAINARELEGVYDGYKVWDIGFTAFFLPEAEDSLYQWFLSGVSGPLCRSSCPPVGLSRQSNL